jgi:hypothetical protein
VFSLRVRTSDCIKHIMRPREILKLAVRLLGLVFLYQGLQALPPGLFQLWRAIPIMNSEMIFSSLATAGWPLLVAYWLLRGAPLIMRTAYPDAADSTEPETQVANAHAKKADA